MLVVLVVLLPMYITILPGSVKIGLILGGIERLLGTVVLVALSRLIMLRPAAYAGVSMSIRSQP